MFSEEDSKIILASWLHNEHLEDVKVIPTDNFPEPFDAVAKHIKTVGTDIGKLYNRFKVQPVKEILNCYLEMGYMSAVHEVLTDEMHRTLRANATPQQVMEHAKKFERNWFERPKAVDLVTSYLDELGDRSRAMQINTGIAVIDRLTYGIHKGQLTVVGARPSVGKSAFTLQVAFDVARKGHKVIFVPLEMTANEITDRLVMRFGRNVTSEALRRGILDADQMNAVNDVLDVIYGMKNFKVIPKVRNLDLIRQTIRDEQPDLIVIDQLSQIAIDGDKTIRERFVEVTRELKAIAIEENTSIWLPCQVNRNGNQVDRITMDNLKESGSIEEDADIVILMSNVQNAAGEYADANGNRYVLVDIAKNRQGALGDEVVMFDCPRFWFKNRAVSGFVPTSNEEEF